MSILVPSSLVDAESSPLATDLWALAYLFLGDWKLDVALETAYKTDVAAAETIAESRLGLVNRPYRTMVVGILGLNRDEGVSIKMIMNRLAQARNLIPLYSDASRLTSAAAASTLSCDTTNRRFQDDARVVVAEPSNGDGMFAQFEVAEIASSTDTDITLKAPLSGSFPKGSKVYPLIEARLLIASSGVHLGAAGFEAQFAFTESTGEMSLIPEVAPGTAPAGYPTAPDGLPIMDRRFNWTADVTGGVQREGGYSELGRDSVVQTHGERARALHSFTVTSLNRADIFNLLQFFESRAGRLYPFWIVSPLCDYEASAITQTTVTVKAVGPEFDWDFRPHIAITLKTGTIYIAEVDLVVRGAGEDVVTFVSPLPTAPSIGDIRSVRMAYRVRFAGDALREVWVTDEIVNAALSVVEVLEEKSVTVAGITDQPSGFRDLGIQGELIGGGFVWPARPFDTTLIDAGSTILEFVPAVITEFTKQALTDRIGNRVLLQAFGAVTARGVWAKFYTDYAGTFDITFRLEDEETGDVLATVALDETHIAAASGDVSQLDNFVYAEFDTPVVITGDRWYRVTVEASPWADLHMSQWAGKGRAEYHVAERFAGTWTPDEADVLALALLFDGGNLS